jgi:uncharacterized protein YyaL (SSP411 family)
MMLADGGEGQHALARHFPFIASITTIGNRATAYICENNVCKLPTNDLETMGRKLDIE